MNILRLLRAAAILCLAGLTGIAGAAPAVGITPAVLRLYVSPTGNDAWSGRLSEPNADQSDGPLASIQAARDTLRRLRQGAVPAAAGEIILRGGTYSLAQPLVLEPQDSDTRYAAFPGEKPILSGGAVIRGWTRGENGIWTAPCPWASGDGQFNQLWVNGQRRTRARTPNEGFFTITSAVLERKRNGRDLAKSNQAFFFEPGDVKDWPDKDQALFVVYHSWATSLLRPAKIDLSSRIVTFTEPAAWPFEKWGTGQRYYVENVREALNAPGEWYLDGKTGLLSYLPEAGEDMSTAEVIAPRLTRLLELRGQADKGQLVHKVRFEGLVFSHQDYVLPSHGYKNKQAAASVEAAVMADGARDCTFERCEMSHTGEYALWLRRGSKNCRVVHCRLNDLGAGGVRVGEVHRAQADELESSGNLIENNHIFDGGRVYAAGVGIWVAQSSHNTIRNNDVHDLNYSGISIGWNWDDTPNRTHHNLIELNHVHHVMRGVLSDGGAIYTLGASPGSTIRRNHFHDVWSYGQPPLGWGIYLDATTSGYTVEGNLVYNTTSGGLMLGNGGHENVVHNNVFALNATHALWPYWHNKPNTFRRNILYLTQGDLFQPSTESSLQQRLASKEPLDNWDQNLYWDTRGPEAIRFYRMTWAQWLALGIDAHGLVTDPQFADVADYDFRLKESSRARELGINPVDVSMAGLYGEPSWVEEARRSSAAPLPLPPPPPPPPPAPQEISDDFESIPVGAPPSDATVSGQNAGASVTVVAELAAGGQHSLKIQDSKSLTPTWQPHIFYTPHLRQGMVRQTFDINLQPGCAVLAEWRDQSAYPQCIGPSVRLEAGAMGQAGALQVAGKKLTDLPAATWIRVEITSELKSGTFTLAITPAGGVREVFTDIAFSGGEFAELHWAGIISVHATDAAFFLDNMEIRRE